MGTVTFVVAVAVAVAIGTVGAYILTMKLATTKRGKKAIKDWSKELTELTMDILKDNMADTSKWEELLDSVD